eukprot:gene12040-13281_t
MAAAFRRVRKFNQVLFPQFESLKQGRLAKVYYLVKDYKAVLVSTYTYAKEKPIRVLLQLSALGLGSYVWKNNPSFSSYVDALLESSGQLAQVSSSIRNRHSDACVRELTECYHQSRLSSKNLGLFTLIFKDNFPDDCDIYDRNCYYMKPRWTSIKERFVDIGFLGRWYQLEKTMIDFDVNDEEFQNS